MPPRLYKIFLKPSLLALIFLTALGGGIYIRWFDELSLVNGGRLSRFLTQAGEFGGIAVGREVSLIFVGDVMLARGIDYFMNKYGDYRYPFLKIADYLKNADLVFGNLENPISDRGKNQGSVYSFRADPRAIEGLNFAGFDALSLANNHIFDWGREALEDTLSILKENDIRSVGAGRNFNEANDPVFVKAGDTKIAFFAYTNLYPRSLEATESKSGVSEFEPELIKKAIFDVRNKAHIIAVSMHWGVEYDKRANEAQRALARGFIDAGADLVIGHHPHVVQEVEHYKQGWIFYSLGNFVFDQNFSEDTKQGLLAEVRVKNNKIFDVRPFKVRFPDTFQPEIVVN